MAVPSPTPHHSGGTLRQASRQKFPGHRPRLLRSSRQGFERRARSAQCSALEEKRLRESCRGARLFWRERFHYRRTALDSPDVRIERHLGRLPGRRRQDRHSVKSLCEILDAPGAQPESPKDRQTRGEAHSKAFAENGSLQVRSPKHGKTLGGSLPRADFPESSGRSRKGFWQKSYVHSRRRLDSIRYPDARYF